MTATVTQKMQRQTGIPEKEWVKLFPKQVTENYTSSLTFIKQLTTIAVSTLTYLKNAFPDDCYYTELFGGISLKVLKKNCSDDMAQFVSTAMQQAFDAFDKKYVHKFALCFYDGECNSDNLFEYHVFEYTYSGEGCQMSINSKSRSSQQSYKCSLEHVKERTVNLLRALTLYVLQNSQNDMPLNYDISLRLYYNEAAPEDYQAPGFMESGDAEHLQHVQGSAPVLGWVETPHHKLVARSFVRIPDTTSDQAMPSDNTPDFTQADNDDFQDNRSSAPESKPTIDANIRCPCGKQDTDDQTLVTCRYCYKQQHAVCFGFLAPLPGHCCDICADQDGSRRPSDPIQLGLERRKRECISIFRRTLYMCVNSATMDGVTLMSRLALTETSAAKMLRLLRSHQILPNTDVSDLSEPRKINPLRLDLTLKRFFNMQEDNVAERLAAESAPPPDPVGDVLSPLEKIHLHNTSNLGTVVENPADKHPVVKLVNDPTLQQYREAILNTEDISEELPLSGSHNPVKDVEKIGKKKLKRKTDSDDEWLPKMPKLRSGAKTKKGTA